MSNGVGLPEGLQELTEGVLAPLVDLLALVDTGLASHEGGQVELDGVGAEVDTGGVLAEQGVHGLLLDGEGLEGLGIDKAHLEMMTVL